MRRVVLAVASAALGLTTLVSFAAPASADVPPAAFICQWVADHSAAIGAGNSTVVAAGYDEFVPNQWVSVNCWMYSSGGVPWFGGTCHSMTYDARWYVSDGHTTGVLGMECHA